MKTTGITRRIDELGRIVIPKEIRKNMHLKTGDLLEIFINDENSITLKKFSLINKEQEFLNYYMYFLAKKNQINIFITNLNEVIFTTVEKYKNIKLTCELEKTLIDNKNIDKISDLKLSNDFVLHGNLSVIPLIPNADLSGFLIIQYKKNNKDEIAAIIDFSKKLIENYLENN